MESPMSNGGGGAQFQDLVFMSLRNSGTLGKLRAQVRAAVMSAVQSTDPDAVVSTRLTSAAHSDPMASHGLDLVLDFLATYEMTASRGVLTQEVPPSIPTNRSRSDVAAAIGVTAEPGVPLLVSLLRSGGASQTQPEPLSQPEQHEYEAVDVGVASPQEPPPLARTTPAGPPPPPVPYDGNDDDDDDLISCSDHSFSSERDRALRAMDIVVDVKPPVNPSQSIPSIPAGAASAAPAPSSAADIPEDDVVDDYDDEFADEDDDGDAF
eukprot:PhM_4_TR12767/c0_g1_i1/m.87541